MDEGKKKPMEMATQNAKPYSPVEPNELFIGENMLIRQSTTEHT